MVVRDVMNADVDYVTTSDTVYHAARLLLGGGEGALPVVDENHQVAGLLSETDLLALAIPSYIDEEDDLSFLPKSAELPTLCSADLEGLTVGDVLRTDILALIEEDDPIVEAARVMVRQRVRRCPVVRDGKLVGVLSRRTLMDILVRPAVEGTDQA